MIESDQRDGTTSTDPLISLLLRLTLGVEEAETSQAAFAVVLSEMCRYLDWPLGHVYILNESADKMVSARTWYPESPIGLDAFYELSETIEFSPHQGTVGSVWSTGAPIAILDVSDNQQFADRLPIEAGGIRAYFAFPVHIKSEVVAVLEFFASKPDSPGDEVLSVINHVSALLGLSMQRHRNLRALLRSEALWAEAQQTARVGHWEWDVAQDKVSWSAELYNIFGLEPESLPLTLEGYAQYLHPADLENGLSKIENAYRHGVPFDYHHRIVRPDGAVRILHARGHPETDPTGKIVRLHGTVQDVTEEKETEVRLAETVRQLSAVMEIGQVVSASLESSAIYGEVMSTVRPLLDAKALILLLEENGRLEIAEIDYENRADLDQTPPVVETSMFTDAWNEGESLIFTREAASRLAPNNTATLLGWEPRAAMAVPIRWRKQPIGVLAAIHSKPDAFGVEALQLSEMAAAWTAIALDNARQYEELEGQLNESDAIVAINSALNTTLDFDGLLQLIVEHALAIVPRAHWITIHLLDTKTDRLELVAHAGLEVASGDYNIEFGLGIAGHVMATGQVLNVPNVQDDPQRLPVDMGTRAQALIVAPVESRDGYIGTISMQSAIPGAFRVEDERLLTTLGVQAGMAIENARLYSEQARARALAERQRERIRAMARSVVLAQEEERERIARELHDESGQSLTSIKISLGLLQSQLPDSLVEVRNGLGDLLKLTDRTMTNLRLLSRNLRPPGLDIYGLDAALEGLCQDFRTHTQVEIAYSGSETVEIGNFTALSMYRFAQEALTNIAKHAQATRIVVKLTEESEHIQLVVQDNGQGFVPPDPDLINVPAGMGLIGMSERLEMVNGYLTIESKPGEGSRLTATVPKVKVMS